MSDLAGRDLEIRMQPDDTSVLRYRRFLLERIGWLLVAALTALILLAIVARMIFLFDPSLFPDTGSGSQIDLFSARFLEHYLATILHLVPALLVVIIGPLQFVRGIRKRNRKLHRIGGYIYLCCGTVVAISGLYIGVLYPFGGIEQGFAEAMAVGVLGLYTLICLFKAFTYAKRKEFAAHREWMIRSWGLMLSVSTQRVVVGVVILVIDIDLVEVFGTALWMAVALNVAVCEYWIALTRIPGSGAKHWKDVDEQAQQASA